MVIFFILNFEKNLNSELYSELYSFHNKFQKRLFAPIPQFSQFEHIENQMVLRCDCDALSKNELCFVVKLSIFTIKTSNQNFTNSQFYFSTLLRIGQIQSAVCIL